jgi:hypothetical protein
MWRVGVEPDHVSIIVISDTTLWAGTLFNITRLDLQTGAYSRYPTTSRVRLLLPVENGQALAAMDAGIFYFDGQLWSQARLSRCSMGIDQMRIDGVGDLWLYYNGRFPCSSHLSGHVPPASDDWREIDYSKASGSGVCEQWPAATSLTWLTPRPPNFSGFALVETHVSVDDCLKLRAAKAKIRHPSASVAVDADQSVWYAQDRVLWHLTGSRAITLPLPGVQIYALAADPRHGVWIGTDQGLAYSDGITFDYPLADLDTRLFYGTPRRIAVDAKGVVWVDLQDNGEVRSFSDAIPRWRHVKNDGINIHDIRAITAAPGGGFWATRGWDLWKSNDPIDLRPVAAAAPPCQLHDLVVDRKGHVWSPSHECGAVEYDPQSNQWQQHQPDAIIEAVTVVPNGRIYLLGQDGIYASSTTSNWQLIMSLHDKGTGRLFAADKRGGLWVASRETGELWHYVNGKETALGQQFPPQALAVLYADDRLWAIDRNTLALYADGTWRYIPTPRLGNISQLAGGPDGRIWLMGDAGVAVYDPAADKQP